MSRRYRKIKEDMPLSAAKIEDDTLASAGSASRLMSFISLYLHLPPFYLLLPQPPSTYKASGTCET
ncbi:MAG: hypothetical protein J6J71_09240 [Prevotella sp.]|nr:hypothetical protein [Prevotella sp.]